VIEISLLTPLGAAPACTNPGRLRAGSVVGIALDRIRMRAVPLLL